MPLKKTRRLILLSILLLFSFPLSVASYEIFIYRPELPANPLFKEKRITIHGEFFGHLQFPSTYPSYNDLSGPEDRWNFGFQNIISLTDNTAFMAQLVTHDDGHKRTKFDWHFSLRHHLFENLVVIIGHDSNHDSDNQSSVDNKPYYLNRNYIGLGIPYEKNSFYAEPFTWFFHHTNQRGHLDLSGEKLRQEYGLRIGWWLHKQIGFHFQITSQTKVLFSLGEAFYADLIIRVRLLEYLELSLGTSLWKDIQESRWGNQKKFYKFIWGIAVPF